METGGKQVGKSLQGVVGVVSISQYSKIHETVNIRILESFSCDDQTCHASWLELET
jgi:hypothetical protein